MGIIDKIQIKYGKNSVRILNLIKNLYLDVKKVEQKKRAVCKPEQSFSVEKRNVEKLQLLQGIIITNQDDRGSQDDGG
jgi:hypothetical protein